LGGTTTPGNDNGDGASNPGSGTETPSEPSCDNCTPTPISSPFVNGYYDRQAAVDFADRNRVSYVDNDPDSGNPIIVYSNDCTNFVSYALRAGGLVETNDWKPNPIQDAWYRTSSLMAFLRSYGFTDGPIFTNTWDIRTPSTGTDSKSIFLRDNNPSSERGQQQQVGSWPGYLQGLNLVKRGDLVFFKYSDSGDWGHVAIITTDSPWPSPTHFNYTTVLNPDPNEPKIIDHSGPNETIAADLPRSLGDTTNPLIQQVEIMYGP
jgi:hypothetical protein